MLDAYQQRRPGVGWSPRTVLKQALYRCHLQCTMKRYRRHQHGFLIVDLTAGDGAATRWLHNCSPGIACKIATKQAGIRVRLYEKEPRTFQMLMLNLTRHLPPRGFERIDNDTFRNHVTYSQVTALCADVTHIDPFFGLREHEGLFAYSDPNSMAGWPFDVVHFDRVLGSQRPGSFMATMGCNILGLKRAPYRFVRERWFEHIATAKHLTQDRERDLGLFWLRSDHEQWAYLQMLPTAVSQDAALSALGIARDIGEDMSFASWRHMPQAFDEAIRVLFLTETERATYGA